MPRWNAQTYFRSQLFCVLPVLFVCATSVFQLRPSRNAGGVETLLFTSQSKNQVTQQWMSGSPPVASTAPRLEVSVQPRCVSFPVAHWHWNRSHESCGAILQPQLKSFESTRRNLRNDARMFSVVSSLRIAYCQGISKTFGTFGANPTMSSAGARAIFQSPFQRRVPWLLQDGSRRCWPSHGPESKHFNEAKTAKKSFKKIRIDRIVYHNSPKSGL